MYRVVIVLKRRYTSLHRSSSLEQRSQKVNVESKKSIHNTYELSTGVFYEQENHSAHLVALLLL